MENKSEKFKRIAQARTNKAISAIRMLGNLSNKTHYEYGADEVKKIFSTLKSEVEDVRALFQKTESEEKLFKFNDAVGQSSRKNCSSWCSQHAY